MAGFLHAQDAIMAFQDLNKHRQAAGELGQYSKLTESLLDAATGLNDHDHDDIDIPANDIYTQEFMLMAYAQLARADVRKTFSESDEGFTYVNLKMEKRASDRVFQQVFPDPKEADKVRKGWWDGKIKAARKKMEPKNLDISQIGAEWVEFDQVLEFYLELYRQ